MVEEVGQSDPPIPQHIPQTLACTN